MALGPDLIEKYPLLSALADPLKPAARKIVGREHEKRQLLAALSRPELCNALLLAEAGTGKCHPVNTTIAVLDDRGYIEMNQLQVGDLVADEYGGPTQVEAIYDSGPQELVAVTLADETTLLCNPGHLLDVCTQATRGVKNRWRTIEVKDLIDQLYVGGKSNVFLPRGKALNRAFNGAAANPYVLGVVIADGLHRSNSEIKVRFSDRISPAIVERVTNELSQAGSYRTTDDGYVLVGKNGGELWADGLYHRHISDAFELGCEQQYIPDVYINASIEQRLDLLRGLFDVAGVRLDQGGRNRFIGWAIETKSVMLAKQVQKLATSLNIRCSVVEDEGTYYVQLYLYQDELDHISWASKGFRKVTQRMVWYLDQAGIGSDDIAILAISETKVKVPMMCIKVSNPTHLYQVGTEHIVTHNTALVQATMLEDTKRLYLEVDPSRMLAYAKTPENMAATLKAFFDEAEQYYRCEKHELVLFIDEFHQIIQLSDAAVEAIKPVLAASGARGIRIIAATTYEEFHRYIANNIPLVERLQRINLNPPDKDTTVLILSGMAERYGVADQFNDDRIFQQIYEYTQRYMPASSQPRKSILVLDSMVGWHRLTGKKMDRHLLADVLEESAGVNVAFKVDGSGIKKALDQKVFSQDLATTAVSKRLQLAVADLNDKSKPMASLLFTGSTGVGKFCVNDTPVPIWTEDGSVSWKKHGELEIGDFVFNRSGKPVEVLGVFPQGEKDIYRVTFTDGRHLDVGSEHLWQVVCECDKCQRMFASTKNTITIQKYLRKHRKVYIPINKAVQWSDKPVPVDPYVMGVFYDKGVLWADGDVALQNTNFYVLNRIKEAIGANDFRQLSNNNWYFYCSDNGARVKQSEVFVEDANVYCATYTYPHTRLRSIRKPIRHIPLCYKTGSIEQRMEFLRGLFDSSATINRVDETTYDIFYKPTSNHLLEDVEYLLHSLGIQFHVDKHWVKYGFCLHVIHIRQKNDGRHWLFSKDFMPPVNETFICDKENLSVDFDYIEIESIEKLPNQQEASCIYVADEEHLYQAGEFIVTHNTELVKQLSNLLFGDNQRHLIRFDMTEYSEDSSLQIFRSELTKRVWDRPHSVVLFDEVEKASQMVTRILLQVLDDGRLSDDNGREISFLNTYIVLTTNAGSEVYRDIAQYAADDTGSGKQLKEYDKLIRRSISTTTGDNRFPPELLGRIDAIVPFQPLSLATQKKIVTKKLADLIKEIMVKHNTKVDISRRVLQYLIEDKGDTDSDAGGARGAVAKMTAEVTTEIAAFINAHPYDKHISVDVVGDLVSDDKTLRTSDAYIKVSAVNNY